MGSQLKQRVSGRVVLVGAVALYASIALYLTFFDTLSTLVLLPFLFTACYFALSLLYDKVSEAHEAECEAALSDNGSGDTRSSELVGYGAIRMQAIAFVIVFAGQMLYWLAYYPGGFNLDALGQWDQVHGYMNLNNWHPVITTMFYWLITRVCDSFAFCIFVQLVLFSLAVSYLVKVLFQVGVPKSLLLVACAYIALNPAIGMNNVCLFKDAYFAIALVFMTALMVKTVSTDGAWLQSRGHMALFVVNLLAIALIRHNGIFYIIPALICLAFAYRTMLKRVLVIAASWVLCFALVQGPVFTALQVEEHGNTTGEIVGVPLALMANVLLEDPENTPEDVRAFLLGIASEDEWRDHYVLGEWDSCKWEFGGTELFANDSAFDILSLTASAALASPDVAYQSVRENMRVVWQVYGSVEWETWVYIEENAYGISEGSNAAFAQVTDAILTASETPVGTLLLWNVGTANLAFLVLLLVVFARKELEKLVLALPVVAYNLLTMLLLCGPSHRYFYFASVLAVPVVLYLLLGKRYIPTR